MENNIPCESEEARLARLRLEVKQRVARANGETIPDPQAASKERPAWASPRRVPESPAERSARLDSEVKRRVLREISSPTVGGRLLKYATPKKQGSGFGVDSSNDATGVLYGVTQFDCEHLSPEAETPKLRHQTADASSSSQSTVDDSDSADVEVLPLTQSNPSPAVQTNGNSIIEPSASCADEGAATASGGEVSAAVSSKESNDPPPERRWAYGSALELAIEEQFSNLNFNQEFDNFGPAQSVDLQAIFERQSISYTKRYSTGDWSQVCYSKQLSSSRQLRCMLYVKPFD